MPYFGKYGGSLLDRCPIFIHFHTFPMKMESAIFSLQNMQFTSNFHTIKILVIGTYPEVLKKIWRHDVIWRHYTSFGHLPDLPPVKTGAHKSGFWDFGFFFMICEKFNVLASIWWVNHQNWTIFDEVMGFSFLLRNFPDFDRFLLILAQNLLTSSLFLNFLDVFWKYLWKWVFLPKFIKITFFLLEIWG